VIVTRYSIKIYGFIDEVVRIIMLTVIGKQNSFIKQNIIQKIPVDGQEKGRVGLLKVFQKKMLFLLI
jgi:hypothetical protein